MTLSPSALAALSFPSSLHIQKTVEGTSPLERHPAPDNPIFPKHSFHCRRVAPISSRQYSLAISTQPAFLPPSPRRPFHWYIYKNPYPLTNPTPCAPTPRTFLSEAWYKKTSIFAPHPHPPLLHNHGSTSTRLSRVESILLRRLSLTTMPDTNRRHCHFFVLLIIVAAYAFAFLVRRESADGFAYCM